MQIAAAAVLIAAGLLLPALPASGGGARAKLTGPSLFDRGARAARRHARRAGAGTLTPQAPAGPGAAPKRKVQGART